MPTVHCPLPATRCLHPIRAEPNPAHLMFLRGDSRGVSDRFSPGIISVLLLLLFSASVGV